MKKLFKLFGHSIVPKGEVEAYQAAVSAWNKVADDRADQIRTLEFSVGLLKEDISILESQLKYKEEQIANSKFLPSTKPNLDLAVDTIIGWNNNRTLATLLKRLFSKVDDSIIETSERYIKTEIKKRKLVNEQV